MFRVTRYPITSKTESGRVGYRKKYRVAGQVRVPAGHWSQDTWKVKFESQYCPFLSCPVVWWPPCLPRPPWPTWPPWPDHGGSRPGSTLPVSTLSSKEKTFFFFKYFSLLCFLMFFNVFLPPTVFESLKGLTIVETIYKKSGSDRIFSPRIGNISSWKHNQTGDLVLDQVKTKKKKEIVGLPRPRGQGKGSFILLYPTKCRSVTRLTQPSAPLTKNVQTLNILLILLF